MQNKKTVTRREFVKLGLASAAGLVVVACGGDGDEFALNYPTPTTATEAIILQPTIQCDDHAETIAQTAGPFYTPDTPQRTSLLEDGVTGTKLVVTGKVLTTDCQPIVGAVLDFWHADDAGDYDNDGFKLRGHQYTDANGDFRLETIVPGRYPGRTRHIHVKVDSPETTLLTTQLYFPSEAAVNEDDGIFDASLVMDVSAESDPQLASFNFVLA